MNAGPITRRKFLILSTSGAVLGLAAACSSQPAPPAPAGTPAPAAPAATKAVTQAPAPAATAVPAAAATSAPAAPKKGGTVTMALGMEMTIFDPVFMTGSPFKGWHRFMVYNSLFRWDKDAAKFQPDLAESWSTPDEKTAIFKLRSGVKWHDGSEFTAEDCKDTLDRVVDPKLASPYAARFVALDKAEVVDKLTLKITAKRPSATLMDGISAIAMTKKGATKDSLNAKPMGTGPFKFVEYVANDRFVLERNPDYFKQGLPLLDKIIIKPYTDKAVALNNLKAGSIDFMLDIAASQAKELQALPDFKVGSFERQQGHWVVFNTTKPPFTDKRVRQAAMMCLDKKAVADLVFGGEAKPAFSPMPADHWSTAPGLVDYPYDPAKAEATLKELGLKPGDLAFKTMARIGRDQEIGPATVWKNGLSKIGWPVEIEILEPSIWLDRYWGGQYQTINGPSAPTPDPVVYYQQCIIGDLMDKGKTYVNQEFRDLVLQADSILDQEKRKPIFHKLSQIMLDDLPEGFSVAPKFFWGYNKKLQGFWINTVIDGEANMEEAFVS